MKRILSVVCLTFAMISTQTVSAGYSCTEWTKTSGISCIFAGNFANLWERQCENSCGFAYGRPTYGPNCDLTTICMKDGNPNELGSACTEWTKENNVTCRNPNTGNWEQSWVRSCQKGLTTTWCSNEDPNQL